MGKKKKRRRRKKKKADKTISVHAIVASKRAPIHKPTKALKNEKKEQSKKACRGKQASGDSDQGSSFFIQNS